MAGAAQRTIRYTAGAVRPSAMGSSPVKWKTSWPTAIAISTVPINQNGLSRITAVPKPRLAEPGPKFIIVIPRLACASEEIKPRIWLNVSFLRPEHRSAFDENPALNPHPAAAVAGALANAAGYPGCAGPRNAAAGERRRQTRRAGN